jgi:hypothetical protein
MSRTQTWPATAAVFVAACVLHVVQPLRQASAQQPSVAPDEITQAILRYAFRHDGRNIRLLEGRVPDDLGPNFYAPSGTRVLGSVVMGSGVLVLATTSAPPESLHAVYTRALGPHGWKPLEMMRRGGFVEAPVDLPLILCRDGASLHIQHVRRTAANDLFLHYRDGAGACQQPRPPAFREMPEPPFPTLYAPPGMGRGSSMRCFPQASGRRGATSTMTTVTGEMSADELLRHYAKQVESEGWRPAAGSGRSVATGAWTRGDSAGTTELKLQVRETGTPGVRCYQVEMTVDAPR